MSTAPIVTGTDGSATAERAVAKAAELAAALDATVHIVTSYEDKPNVAWVAAGGMAVDDPTLVEDARIWAEEIVSRTQRHLVEIGVRCETHVCRGEPADALIA